MPWYSRVSDRALSTASNATPSAMDLTLSASGAIQAEVTDPPRQLRAQSRFRQVGERPSCQDPKRRGHSYGCGLRLLTKRAAATSAGERVEVRGGEGDGGPGRLGARSAPAGRAQDAKPG